MKPRVVRQRRASVTKVFRYRVSWFENDVERRALVAARTTREALLRASSLVDYSKTVQVGAVVRDPGHLTIHQGGVR